MRDSYRKRNEIGDTLTLQLWLIGISICNLLISIVVVSVKWSTNERKNPWVGFFIYPYFDIFIRPVLFSLMIRSVKSFWRRYLTVIVGSLPMVILIMVYVFYFGWIGNRLFAGTLEGVKNFSNLNDSFFYMFVLLTTSNFPDVMLTSYERERRYGIFFFVYLMIGLFMLMNLLLAIFYSNYTDRVDASIDRFQQRRNKFFVQLFRIYDVNRKGEIGKAEVF